MKKFGDLQTDGRGKELPESFVTAEDEGVFSVRDYPNARRIPPYKYYAKTHAKTKQKPKRKPKTEPNENSKQNPTIAMKK